MSGSVYHDSPRRPEDDASAPQLTLLYRTHILKLEADKESLRVHFHNEILKLEEALQEAEQERNAGAGGHRYSDSGT